jgi:tetratricopeptide (TPR) repeat protein
VVGVVGQPGLAGSETGPRAASIPRRTDNATGWYPTGPATARQTPCSMPKPDTAFEQAKAAFLRGVSLHEAGEFAKAETAFLASLQTLPGRSSTLLNLGAAQWAQGKAEAALSSLAQCLQQEPDNVQALCHRAAVLQALGREEEAWAHHEQALRHESGCFWRSKRNFKPRWMCWRRRSLRRIGATHRPGCWPAAAGKRWGGTRRPCSPIRRPCN